MRSRHGPSRHGPDDRVNALVRGVETGLAQYPSDPLPPWLRPLSRQPEEREGDHDETDEGVS